MRAGWIRKSVFLVLAMFIVVNLLPFYSIAFADSVIPEGPAQPGDSVQPGDPIQPEDPVTPDEHVNPEESPQGGDASKGGEPNGGTPGEGGKGSESQIDWLNSDIYKVGKLTLKDLFHGLADYTVTLKDLGSADKMDWWGFGTSSYSFHSTFIRGAIGLNVSGKGGDQLALDIWESVDNVVGLTGYFDIQKIRGLFTRGGSAVGLGQESGNIFTQLTKPAAPLSTFAKVGGITGIGLSTIETSVNTYNAFVAEDGSVEQADASLGIVKGLGGIAIASAVFIGGPAGLAVAAGGVAAVAIGAFGKYFTDHPTVRKAVTAPVRYAKKGFHAVKNGVTHAAKKVGDGIKSAGNKVKDFLGF